MGKNIGMLSIVPGKPSSNILVCLKCQANRLALLSVEGEAMCPGASVSDWGLGPLFYSRDSVVRGDQLRETWFFHGAR